MPYCKKCGSEMADRARFCPNCGAPTERASALTLASWGERFIAWVIDMILLVIALSWLRLPGFHIIPSALGRAIPNWVPFVDFGFNNVIYFIYWTFLEGTYGQSVGKMVMKIYVADLDGGHLDMGKAAIQSIGKAFLLPIDCILGWFMYPSRQQRLFNNLSNTVVLKKYE
jgi:uncharacterized RDD family membrane protein YckC